MLLVEDEMNCFLTDNLVSGAMYSVAPRSQPTKGRIDTHIRLEHESTETTTDW